MSFRQTAIEKIQMESDSARLPVPRPVRVRAVAETDPKCLLAETYFLPLTPLLRRGTEHSTCIFNRQTNLESAELVTGDLWRRCLTAATRRERTGKKDSRDASAHRHRKVLQP